MHYHYAVTIYLNCPMNRTRQATRCVTCTSNRSVLAVLEGAQDLVRDLRHREGQLLLSDTSFHMIFQPSRCQATSRDLRSSKQFLPTHPRQALEHPHPRIELLGSRFRTAAAG